MVDVLGKITELRQQRNWTEYALAEQSEVPQSTISSWYNKGKMPSLGSLEKIACAFQIPIAQLLAEGDSVELSQSQRELITKWASLDEEKKEVVKKLIELL